MKSIFALLISILVCGFTQADEFESSFVLSQGQFETDNAQFSNHVVFEFRQSWMPKRNAGWELGVQTTSGASDKGSDVKGQYESNLDTRDILLGFKLTGEFCSICQAYFRVGVSWGTTTISVKESFNGLQPGGDVEIQTTSNGYYAGLGLGAWVEAQYLLSLDWAYHERPNLFDGESEFPFDLISNQWGINLTHWF